MIENFFVLDSINDAPVATFSTNQSTTEGKLPKIFHCNDTLTHTPPLLSHNQNSDKTSHLVTPEYQAISSKTPSPAPSQVLLGGTLTEEHFVPAG